MTFASHSNSVSNKIGRESLSSELSVEEWTKHSLACTIVKNTHKFIPISKCFSLASPTLCIFSSEILNTSSNQMKNLWVNLDVG